MTINEEDFPALYNSADSASLKAQSAYFNALRCYLILLIIAALVSFSYPADVYAAIASALLFLITLGILIWLKVQKPEDTWYNGRAVAESVKTRTWRWMMKAEPYESDGPNQQVQTEFLNDLKAISDVMIDVRSLPWEKRLEVYVSERIDNQSLWYSNKSQLNKHLAKKWFVFSIVLHSLAILLLLYRIKEPSTFLPIEVVATAASAVLTWVQAKKHNELNSSYALAAHEIVLIKGESVSVTEESRLSEFIINSEYAFSREHTQWVARKNV
ncbi:DUF4231 domain-containing protein [Vibrio alginolyticus]